MLTSLLLAAAASAAEPTWEAHAHAGWVGQGGAAWSGGGVGGAAGVVLAPRAALELSGLVGVHGGGGLLLDLRPELRLSPRPWTRDSGGLSLTGGAGLALRDGARLAGAVGAAWDAPAAGRMGLRVGARWLVAGEGVRAGLMTVGLVGHPPPEPAEPPPPPPPEPAPPPPEPAPAEPEAVPPLSVEPEAARIWVPHPWCDWLTPAELEALRPELGPDVELLIAAEGHVPARVPNGAGGAVALDPAPLQGGLVVVARPGDRVRTGGLEQDVGPDGVLIVTSPQGRVSVEVLGGGRRARVDAVVPSGHAVYRRVAAPEPVELRFPVGRSTLAPEHRVVLRGLAEDAGGWTLEVAGLASPEGDAAANRVLAEERARAVAAALVAAGLPEAQVRLGPPVVAEDGVSDPAAWRAARITPVPPTEAP